MRISAAVLASRRTQSFLLPVILTISRTNEDGDIDHNENGSKSNRIGHESTVHFSAIKYRHIKNCLCVCGASVHNKKKIRGEHSWEDHMSENV